MSNENKQPVIICARTGYGYTHTEVEGIDIHCAACNHLIRLCDSSLRAMRLNGFDPDKTPPKWICHECTSLIAEHITAENMRLPTEEQLEEMRRNGAGEFIEYLRHMKVSPAVMKIIRAQLLKNG